MRITDPTSSEFNRRHRRRRLRVLSFHIRHIAVYWEPRRSLVFILHCSCCCYYCSPTASAGCWTAGLRFHHTGILQQCRCRAVISFLQSAFVPAFVNMFFESRRTLTAGLLPAAFDRFVLCFGKCTDVAVCHLPVFPLRLSWPQRERERERATLLCRLSWLHKPSGKSDSIQELNPDSVRLSLCLGGQQYGPRLSLRHTSLASTTPCACI